MNAIGIEFRRNRAEPAVVAEHLRACDAAFVPPLADRVDLDAYAAKIVAHAERFEAWSEAGLAGLVAVYCNDPGLCAAFVTSVSVLPRMHGRGIAAQLLETCIGHVRAAGFVRLELEVDPRNKAARRLYARLGFASADAREGSRQSHLALHLAA